MIDISVNFRLLLDFLSADLVSSSSGVGESPLARRIRQLAAMSSSSVVVVDDSPVEEVGEGELRKCSTAEEVEEDGRGRLVRLRLMIDVVWSLEVEKSSENSMGVDERIGADISEKFSPK